MISRYSFLELLLTDKDAVSRNTRADMSLMRTNQLNIAQAQSAVSNVDIVAQLLKHMAKEDNLGDTLVCASFSTASPLLIL